jgi:hypothetical protein
MNELDDYIDKKGIVVDWPHTLENKIKAVIDYANEIERQLETIERPT